MCGLCETLLEPLVCGLNEVAARVGVAVLPDVGVGIIRVRAGGIAPSSPTRWRAVAPVMPAGLLSCWLAAWTAREAASRLRPELATRRASDAALVGT